MRSKFLFFSFSLMIAVMIYSCQDAEQLKQQVYYTNGRDLYIKHCQNCHGINGEGLGQLAPPLTDSTFLKEHRGKLACYIKYGISDTVLTIHNQSYEGKMPDNPGLANIDIAQLLVYITNTYGNKQGMFTPEQVAKDLESCK